MSTTVNIDDMSYKMLRKLAKQYGISGKQKAVILRAKLKNALKPVHSLDGGSEHSDEQKDNSATKINALQPNMGSWLGSNTGKNDDCRPSSSLVDEGTNSSGSKLNSTYELESPKLAFIPATTKEKSEGKNESLEEFPEASRRHGSPIVSNDRPKKAVKYFVARPVPNFSRIHARAASKMESLPEFMLRMATVRPPFASPTYQPSKITESKPISSTVKSNRALSDVSNQVKHAQPAKSSMHFIPDKVSTATKHREGHRFSRSSEADNNAATLVRKHTPKIPADSAFARRKAYDMKLNLARLSCHTPSRSSASDKLHSHNAGRTPYLPTPSQPTKSTVPRRDPRDCRPGLNVLTQRERFGAIVLQNRTEARRTLMNAHRGL